MLFTVYVVVLARGNVQVVKRDWPRDVSARWLVGAAGPSLSHF
jgi:hypothetical protein